MLKEGVVAPDFSAVLDDGQRFQLSAYKGEKNVVLYFYPRNFTPGCTRQACLFRDNYGGLDAYDAILVGISNNTAESHVRFRVKYKLPFPLIADPDKKLIELYDAKGPLGLLTARVTYVIDKVGVIRRVLRHDFAVNRHWPETRDALSALKIPVNRRADAALAILAPGDESWEHFKESYEHEIAADDLRFVPDDEKRFAKARKG